MVRASILAAVLVICSCTELAGQSVSPRLPSAERIVERYLKVIGGKKRTAEIRYATYEWVIHLDHQIMGTARTQIKAPTRNGARLRYSFSAKTNLLVRITDEVRKTVTRLEEYRLPNGLLEPHRLSLSTGGTGELTLVLDRIRSDETKKPK